MAHVRQREQHRVNQTTEAPLLWNGSLYAFTVDARLTDAQLLLHVQINDVDGSGADHAFDAFRVNMASSLVPQIQVGC